ncbi:hypothetical protein [Blastomonas aquatica]|uniref:Uncharacterized protein n=1 Tax=Blastomonas aquatica TaxID=1510276 RepID=A0ABQ1J5F4_9SPHN|nr:hypothetical protein [Blastomonas aquatica]GGB59192.1 hypothetical protein GCM10010833_12500 [Blastomonas aquatica]
MKTGTLAALLLVGTAFAAPASAQNAAGDKVVQKIVYGNEACEPSNDPNEIVVCMRMDEQERFRIPEKLRSDPNAIANTSWTERVRSMETVGNFGTDSCSPVGAGGFTGCTQSLVQNARAEKQTGEAAVAGRLIEEERERRLSNIDADAAAVEARDQEVSAELDQRKAEREAAAAAMRAQADGLEPERRPDPEAPSPE